MKNNWKNSFLTDIASISTGKWDANHATENGKYRFYTCAYDYLLCDTKRFQGECLVLPGNGVNVGEVFYYEGEFDAYQRTYVISDIKIFPKYLHYHMLLYWKALGVKKQYGSATNFIKIGNFKDYEVQFPPLSEQKKIVEVLDQAFAGIEQSRQNTKQNLKNAKEIFESYLQGVFENKGDDWEEKKLGEVTDIVNGGTPKTNIKEYWDGDIYWITPADLGKLQTPIVSETSRKISSLGLQKSSAKLFPEHSVILSTRAPIGHLAVNKVAMSTNQGCRGIVPKKILDTWYLYYFLKKNVQLLNELGTGTTFKELSKGVLSNIVIPFPSIEEQQNIVLQLDALRAETQKLEAIYTQKLSDLEELKKSLLQKAFTGEL